jgi:hypothetical protein
VLAIAFVGMLSGLLMLCTVHVSNVLTVIFKITHLRYVNALKYVTCLAAYKHDVVIGTTWKILLVCGISVVTCFTFEKQVNVKARVTRIPICSG